MSIRKWLGGVVLVAVLFAAPCKAQATVILQDLFDGDTLSANDKIFSDWGWSSVQGNNAPNFDLIEVVPLTDDDLYSPGVAFYLNGQFTVGPSDSVGLSFYYTVATSDGSARIKDVSLALWDAFRTGEGSGMEISESIFASDGTPLATTYVDHTSTPDGISDSASFTPQSSIRVETNIFVYGGEGTATLLQFRQRYSQTLAIPEPSSLAVFGGLFGLGLIGHWWRRRRKAA